MKELMNNKSVAAYARISNEDGYQVTSIENQVELITNYCNEHNLILKKIYKDDGFTGTNFDRPGFKEMINDLDAGIVDTVITKDISRLGRNLLGVGRYVDEYFINNSIRYISINDNYDNAYPQEDDNMVLKMFLNDYYAKECKKKSKANVAFNATRKNFSTGIYGYLRTKDGETVIDPVTAPIVQRIFKEYAEGRRTKDICSDLNAEGIPSPAYYKKLNGHKQLAKYKAEDIMYWKGHSITDIVNNIEYTGVAANCMRKVVNGKCQWTHNPIIVKDDHEPLISEVLFNICKEARSKKNTFTECLIPHVKGTIYCPICNKAYVFEKDRYGNFYRDRRCGKRIDVNHIEDALYKYSLSKIAKAKIDRNAFIESVNKELLNGNSLAIQEKKFNEEKANLNIQIQSLFEKYSMDEISKEVYQEYMNLYNDSISVIDQKLNTIKLSKFKEDGIIDKINEFQNKLFNLDIEHSDKYEIISQVVKKVYVIPADNKLIFKKIEYVEL